jgi:hypothetical protein
MRSDQVHIDSPCHESWEAMEGGAERRFCGVCRKHVHDLSAMNLDDARALLRTSEGESLCVRYSAEADGTLRFRDLVPRARLTRGLVRTAFAASILAACSPQDRAPTVDVGHAAISSPTAEEPADGCEATPAPQAHLPPGHLLHTVTGPAPGPFAPPAGPHVPPRVPIAAPAPQPVYTPPPPEPPLPPRPHTPPPSGGFAPPPPPPSGFAPPPPLPQPFPGSDPSPTFSPPPLPPDEPPLMGAIAPRKIERMGRIAPSHR